MNPPDTVAIVTSIPPKLRRMHAGAPMDADYQDLCLQSWRDCGFRILSVNDQSEILQLAERYPDVCFIPTTRNASAITGRNNPYLADLLFALADAPEATVGIVNSDIVLEPSTAWRTHLPQLVHNAIVVAQRLDVKSLTDGALSRYHSGFDAFFFARDQVRQIATRAMPFALGLPWWDYWLPLMFALSGNSIRCLTRPAAAHLFHDTAYQPGAWPQFALALSEAVETEAPPSGAPVSPELSAIVDACRELNAQLRAKSLEYDDQENQVERLALLCPDALRAEEIAIKMFPAVPSASADPHRISPQTVFSQFDERTSAARELEAALGEERAGRLDKATDLFRSALKKAPRDTDVLTKGAQFLQRRGNAEGAVKLLRRAETSHPYSAPVLVALGVAVGATGDRPNGIAALRRALERDPLLPSAHYNHVMAMRGTPEYRDALAGFERALAAKRDFFEGYHSYLQLRRDLSVLDHQDEPLDKCYGQSGEDALLDEFFGRRRDGFFVEIGARDGIYLSPTYALERRGWSGLCIEPLPSLAARCAANRTRSRTHSVLCTAAALAECRYHADPGTIFSGLSADEEVPRRTYLERGVDFAGFEACAVSSVNLDALLEASAPPLDLLAIDRGGDAVQGARDTLSGITLARHRPRVILVADRKSNDRRILDTYFLDRGYVWARTLGASHFYLRDNGDLQNFRAITVVALHAWPPHPRAPSYSPLGYDRTKPLAFASAYSEQTN